MYDQKSGYEQKSRHDQKRIATSRQIELFKSLREELGSPAIESDVLAFSQLSVGDASDKLSALIDQRKKGEIS